MKIARVLAGSAAAAVMVLVPQAAFAADDGQRRWRRRQRRWLVGNNGGSVGNAGGSSAQGLARSAHRGGLPSTGSSALDTAIGGAGLLLLVGGGAAGRGLAPQGARDRLTQASRPPQVRLRGSSHCPHRSRLAPAGHPGAAQRRRQHAKSRQRWPPGPEDRCGSWSAGPASGITTARGLRGRLGPPARADRDGRPTVACQQVRGAFRTSAGELGRARWTC